MRLDHNGGDEGCAVTDEFGALDLFSVAVTVLYVILGELKVFTRSIDLVRVDPAR
jgi:hypothetical protein